MCICVSSRISLDYVTRSCECCVWVNVMCEWVPTGWRLLIGSPKMQIIIHKRATKYRSFLRKMTYKVRDPMSLRHPVCEYSLTWTHSLIWVLCVSVMCDMTFSSVCVCLHALVWITWLVHVRVVCEWLLHVCGMTYSYVWHDSFMCVTWLIHTCDMTHSYVRHDSFICVTWLIHMCDMTRSYVWHDSFICVTW